MPLLVPYSTEILILDLPRCIHQPLHFKSALIIIALAAGVATGPCRGGTLISAQASVKLPINSGFEVPTCRVPRGFPESGGFNDEPTSYVPLKGLGYHTQLLPSPPEVGFVCFPVWANNGGMCRDHRRSISMTSTNGARLASSHTWRAWLVLVVLSPRRLLVALGALWLRG
jgi:hypothetical protein